MKRACDRLSKLIGDLGGLPASGHRDVRTFAHLFCLCADVNLALSADECVTHAKEWSAHEKWLVTYAVSWAQRYELKESALMCLAV